MPATSCTDSPSPPAAWRLSLKSLRLAGHILAGFAILAAMPLLRRRAGQLAGWWYRGLLRIMGIELEVRGPTPAPGTLVVANHVSWLDIIVFGGLLDAAFVSKSEVGDWAVIGRFARLTGTIFLPRGAGETREASNRIGTALAAGRCVVLFPEATTRADLLPSRFHARLFAAAIDGDHKLQPAALHYPRDDGHPGHHPDAPWVGAASLAPHFVTLFRQHGLRARLTFCPPVPVASRDRRALAEQSHAAIASALAASAEPEAD